MQTEPAMSKPLRLGLAGLGTVGVGVIRVVQKHADLLSARAGREIEISAVSARSRSRDRGVDLSGYAWVDDPVALATRDDETVRHVIGRSGHDLGLILRSAAAEADPDDIAADIADTAALAQAVLADADGPVELLLDGPGPDLLAWREWVDVPAHSVIDTPGCFGLHGALDQIDALDAAMEPLTDGASFYVEATRALIAVDVNTGADTSPAAGLKANLGTARALPRALRLRGLGGQIVIDLAPMPKKDRRAFEQALRAAFRTDSIETSLVGWTPLGHFELQRKRERLPLSGAFG